LSLAPRLVPRQVIQDQPWTAARRRTAVLRFLTAKLQAASEQLQLEGARGLLELAINREHHNEVDHACLAALVARMCSPNVEVGWWRHQQLAAGRQQEQGFWLYTMCNSFSVFALLALYYVSFSFHYSRSRGAMLVPCQAAGGTSVAGQLVCHFFARPSPTSCTSTGTAGLPFHTLLSCHPPASPDHLSHLPLPCHP
jgi:hypothetical protein